MQDRTDLDVLFTQSEGGRQSRRKVKERICPATCRQEFLAIIDLIDMRNLAAAIPNKLQYNLAYSFHSSWRREITLAPVHRPGVHGIAASVLYRLFTRSWTLHHVFNFFDEK